MKTLPAATLLLLLSLPGQALNIQLNASPGMDADALAGFEMAASYWESRLTDSVQVNIDIGYQNLGSQILGQAGSNQVVVSAANFFNALGTDSTTSYDALAVGNLPALSGSGGLSFLTQKNTEGGSTAVSLDNDNSANNRFLALNTANAKALGLYSSTAADASITFSSAFSWDFNPSDGNGVGAGLQDFVGVAIHEIGHALGFTSGVDSVDFAITGDPASSPPYNAPFDLDGYAVFTSLDMFRYSAPGTLNLAAGGTPYFSLNGGATNLGAFSTGTEHGDGAQTSHWKDNLSLGIMDPTARPPGQANEVTQLDLIAMDVIGWNVSYAVPEPASAVLAAIALLGLARRRRSC